MIHNKTTVANDTKITNWIWCCFLDATHSIYKFRLFGVLLMTNDLLPLFTQQAIFDHYVFADFLVNRSFDDHNIVSMLSPWMESISKFAVLEIVSIQSMFVLRTQVSEAPHYSLESLCFLLYYSSYLSVYWYSMKKSN